jgi:hypothetical protein
MKYVWQLQMTHTRDVILSPGRSSSRHCVLKSKPPTLRVECSRREKIDAHTDRKKVHCACVCIQRAHGTWLASIPRAGTFLWGGTCGASTRGGAKSSGRGNDHNLCCKLIWIYGPTNKVLYLMDENRPFPYLERV